ncbi:exodeoxyribonuclease VII small subunit [Listeria grandensis]|uniref:Exodeoxyribonuclease 7 small subunit n=2 Tax=Listeria grandensis TaxID=1494963 RepID=W7BX71_9LIST|nr:exodeoxyribonuclease VII small subunit [Listeria grandensis]EUJ24903.1 exodeoxyribonuclease VII small subunit [Listeria grandensis FSL F6-0971]MBC1473078.1 exodeoxyribonuclease VII small subunit [Listeria grandensis]MBC1935024.1 exodeoxyribonuclease VII small subunit [Listeria grandensis]
MATKKVSYEEAMKELENIVQALEEGNVSLEDSLDMYQRGIALTKLCQEKLAAAEDKLAKVVTESDEEEPFQAEEGTK